MFYHFIFVSVSAQMKNEKLLYLLHSIRQSVRWLNSRRWLAACERLMSSVMKYDTNTIAIELLTSRNIWWWVGCLYGAYSPGERIWIDSNGKTTQYGKILKILFRKFTWRHWSTLLCSNVVKFVRWEIGKIVHYSHDKNWLTLKLSLLRRSRQKSSRASPQHLAHIVLDFVQISSLSVEL